MPDITNIPAPRVQAVDSNGIMTRQWYRYLFNLFNLVGAGGSDVSNTDAMLTPNAAVNNPNMISYGPSYPMGYGNGTGGSVTQLTSRTTDVTLNSVCGQITLFSDNAAGGSSNSFTVFNSTVSDTDVVMLNFASGVTANKCIISVTAVSTGSFRVQLYAFAGTGTEAPILNFAVIKSVIV